MADGEDDHGQPLGIVLRHPDGTPFSKTEVIIKRRGAFLFLPVLCSNDLVHGSWWFVWGSVGCVLFAILPLIDGLFVDLSVGDDAVPALDSEATWSLLAFSGLMFTIGSWAFKRAFEEPAECPLFWYFKHCQTDELLGAWLFLFGTIPAVPYSFIFFCLDPGHMAYLGATIASCFFVFGSWLFVKSCYPTGNPGEPHKREALLLPVMIKIFGPQRWVTRHLANDWLAATWIIYWANLLFTFACFLAFADACDSGSGKAIFVWFSSFANSVLFLIGSAYFVAGSYPHAEQFYYCQSKFNIGYVPTENPFKRLATHAARRASIVVLRAADTGVTADPEANGATGEADDAMENLFSVFGTFGEAAGDMDSTTGAGNVDTPRPAKYSSGLLDADESDRNIVNPLHPNTVFATTSTSSRTKVPFSQPQHVEYAPDDGVFNPMSVTSDQGTPSPVPSFGTTVGDTSTANPLHQKEPPVNVKNYPFASSSGFGKQHQGNTNATDAAVYSTKGFGGQPKQAASTNPFLSDEPIPFTASKPGDSTPFAPSQVNNADHWIGASGDDYSVDSNFIDDDL